MKKIVLFASGSGSNVENIIHFFKGNPEVSIKCVLSNNKEAKVFERCNRLEVSALYFNRHSFYQSDCILELLKSLNPDLIVLAGFLWKIPDNLIQNFPDKIVNIHPALLPKYGGKGMYGMHVHKSVKENNEPETGITIHFVNENYDEGAIIAQKKVTLELGDTPETIAEKVHQLEYEYFPKVIQQVLMGQ
ncbi:Phosphoribosylglycinamide formyltransferase [Arenibacter antarcticus]|uniref:Phosphoribosylglycinamide formyltransferase n=1 Tax=Arenibacter antarcticus TaxID=2040469 RepID=A0ABW5VGU8_9FLAO|nr:phosphoribosylglycinamide formyltransferase [Arenibacter sp. H213]MCM4166649.1 phosphoribosylglycinamide formyltransferase [Arenibacter sp. H213]